MNEQTFTAASEADAMPPKVALGRPARVALTYVVLSIAWILYSDSLLLALVPDVTVLASIGREKGLAFVLVTGLLLYRLLLRRDRQGSQPQARRRRSGATRASACPAPRPA